MPVKWTPELDQLLLLKILETHEIKLDAKKVIEAWPAERGEKPTPRAITERLVRIRNGNKGDGKDTSKLSIANTTNKSGEPKTPSKPRGKATASKTSTPSKTNGSSATTTPKGKSPVKREHGDMVKQEPLNLDGINETPPSNKPGKPTFKVTTTVGHSLRDRLGENSVALGATPGVNKGMSRLSVQRDEDEESPTKKPRLASATSSGVDIGFRVGQENGIGVHNGGFEADYDDDEEYAV
ncbi:MAG: hypothetical protein M1831_006808 [Alyxoria varia]|nr:MAG: hypothetical protein M1831_006808 [Alyxoria varia]